MSPLSRATLRSQLFVSWQYTLGISAEHLAHKQQQLLRKAEHVHCMQLSPSYALCYTAMLHLRHLALYLKEEYDSDLTFLQNLQEAENLHLSSVFYPLIMKVGLFLPVV